MTDFKIHDRIYSFKNWLEEGRILPGSGLSRRIKPGEIVYISLMERILCVEL